MFNLKRKNTANSDSIKSVIIYDKENIDANRVQQFYLKEIPTDAGYYLDDILHFSHFSFETYHDFIQWLFPIHTQSAYNENAPVLSKEKAFDLILNSDIKDNVIKSFEYICKMYGFSIVREGEQLIIAPNSDFTGYWITPNNHNYLRLTRILICLTNMKLFDYAKALLLCLEELYELDPESISEETLRYWQDAVK